ncbi:MAG: 23S rRNA (pseudouridine(1915)-N(3))-methyltransferase RlmH [Lactobacillaceae bacterium]|jgi:23S rRNA (pseudouridine1915-N3)-methyltransferase|nr:23S rRNA (pseudouridine(1915)-N(3))-methyltransferase RlmH [Lactobacillaceae bacterium]
MLKINLIVVGKIKEKYFTDAIVEYTKRLSRFSDFNIIELKDLPTPENDNENDQLNILKKEGDLILSKVNPKDYVIAMTIEGNIISSELLAEKMSKLAFNGFSTIDFIIGGSLGLSNDVKNRADYQFSLGKITLPHQLARVVVSEQIYRSFMINNHTPYHK